MRCARFIGILTIVAWASCCFAGEDTLIKDPVQLARKFIEVNQKKVEVYRTIKDDATALAAKPLLAELEHEMCIFWASRAMSKGERKFELAMENTIGLSAGKFYLPGELHRVQQVAPKFLEIQKEIMEAQKKEMTEIGKRLGIDLDKAMTTVVSTEEELDRSEPPLTPQRIEGVMAQIKDEPEYAFPNRQAVRRLMDAKVGDWVKLRSLFKRQGHEGSENITWYTVTGVSETRALLLEESEVQINNDPPTRSRVGTRSAKFSLEGSKITFLLAQGTRTASGKEELRIGQKTFACDWVEVKSTNQSTGAVTLIRVWSSTDAPFNGVLKQTLVTETPGKGQTRSTLIEVIDFGRGAPVPASTKGK